MSKETIVRCEKQKPRFHAFLKVWSSLCLPEWHMDLPRCLSLVFFASVFSLSGCTPLHTFCPHLEKVKKNGVQQKCYVNTSIKKLVIAVLTVFYHMLPFFFLICVVTSYICIFIYSCVFVGKLKYWHFWGKKGTGSFKYGLLKGLTSFQLECCFGLHNHTWHTLILQINQAKPECGRQTLVELLIRPVQRLPSVALLLNGNMQTSLLN